MSSSKDNGFKASDHYYDEEDESFLLQWNNHNFSMSSSFAALRDREDFVDVTLVAKGDNEDNDLDEDDDDERSKTRTFSAHKVILSASSPHLRHLLRRLPKWQHPILVFRDVPAEDLEAILTFVYVGKVQVSRHQLKSFLKSAEILRIRGLTHNAVTPEQKFQSTDEQQQHLESSIEENSESQDQCCDEDHLKRNSSHLSDVGGPKRPRLTLRPPPKPVTTTITPALQKLGTKTSDSKSINPTKGSLPGVVVKCETSDNDDEANFVDPASTSSRNYPDNLLTDEDQLVIPNLGLDSSSIEDIRSPHTASTSDGASNNSLRSVGSKSSLCPLCRAVLSNVNALSYHMNYLHGITDTQFFTGAAIKEDMS